MKRIYTVFIALSSMVVGFALSSFYSKSSAPAPLPMGTYNFSSNNSIIRVVKGNSDNNYYLNILSYLDTINIGSLDSINLRFGATISNVSGTTYQFVAGHGGIDSIPRSVYKTGTSYTLIDSTIYSRYGVIYGKTTDGSTQSFNSSDVIWVKGGAGSTGTVVFGIMPIDVYE